MRGRALVAFKPQATPRLPLKLLVIGVGVITFFSTKVGDYPLSDWVFLCAAGTVVMTVLAGRSHELAPLDARRAPTAVTISILVLLTAGTVSTLWAIDPVRSISVVLRLAWLSLGWLWLFRSVTVDRVALGRILRAFRITVLISSSVAIAGSLGVPIGKEDPTGRQLAFHAHPNHLGALLALGAMFFVLDLNPSDKPRKSMVPFRLIGLGVVLFGMGATGSITAVGAVVVGTVAIFTVRYLAAEARPFDPLGPVKRMLMLVVVALFLIWLVNSGSRVVERFTSLGEDSGYTRNSADSRGEFISYVMDRFDQYLVVGVGFDAETPTEAANDENELAGANHNMPLKLLYQAGLPALVAMTVLLVVTLRMGWTLALSTRGTPLFPVAVTLIGAVVVVNTLAQTQPMTYEREYWLPYALVAALWSLRKAELTRQARSEASAELAGPDPSTNGSSNGDHPEVVPEIGYPA
jgi:hypothetical protein